MKKTIDYYLSLPYRLEIVPDTVEGGYGARYPELPGCITCADSLEEVVMNAEDAKRAWLEAALKDKVEIPEPEQDDSALEYSGQFKIRMPKSLHKSLSVHAKQEGISMNQYCIYLLSKNDATYAMN
ncbi:MAG: toxin-antitoxin system HicB family antitoxin [Lachnospiraceae bacterium]|nr:toxin-antitoxin system HicB family antitoxin [Lachnospiraceae bacterium]